MRALIVAIVVSVAVHGQAPAPGQPTRPQNPARATPARDRAATTGTAVLRGQVLDVSTGRAIRRARVMVYGSGVTNPPPIAQTDAEGRFELRDLPAGKFSVSVTKTGYLSLSATNAGKPVPPIEVKDGETIDKIVLRLAKGGVIAGQVLDEYGDPLAGAEVRALRYRYIAGERQLTSAMGMIGSVYTDDLGAFRMYGLEPGDYYLSARGGRDMMPFGGAPANAEGPAQTFFPGTANVADATRVSVRPGRETAGVIFPVVLTRLSRIRGRVVTSSGEPFAGSITVSMREGSGGSSSFGNTLRPDGTFDVTNLQPGSYVLTARPNNFPDPAAEQGQVVVTVNGEELNDVVIVTGPTAIARGRITTDEGIPLPFPTSAVSLTTVPADPRMSFISSRPATIRSDWTFELTGLFGRVHMRPAIMSSAALPVGSWRMKAVLVDGHDVTDTGLEFRSGQVVDNIEVVYTRKISRLSGQLKNERGEPAEGWVVLFPSDESRWTAQSRYVRAVRVIATGEYRFQPTPFDDYLIVGVRDLEDGQWQDPEFLRAVKELASRIAINENETKEQDVKLVDWRR